MQDSYKGTYNDIIRNLQWFLICMVPETLPFNVKFLAELGMRQFV